MTRNPPPPPHACRRASLLLAALVTVLAATGAAVAQPATAQAEHLFREGKRLMSEGNIGAACDAFEGSYAKDPAISTLLNLADCREKNQQYASAWAHFIEAARKSRTTPDAAALRKTAQERADAVEGRMSYLIINVPDEARLEGLTITRNGIPVEPVEWNRDIPVDGGVYEIEGKAPSYEAWSTTVKVGNAKDKQSVNVPRFRQAIAGGPTVPAEPAQPRDRGSSFTGKRKAAVGLWVIGAAAIGGGAAFELKSQSTYDDAKAAMDNARRHELTDSANTQRRIGLAAGALGVVAVGAGAYLWFTGRSADHDGVEIAPDLSSDRAGIALLGSF